VCECATVLEERKKAKDVCVCEASDEIAIERAVCVCVWPLAIYRLGHLGHSLLVT
jgi:hypothetical protein